ncbi:MAG: ATP-binding protein, partial [Haloarculaceae archaeon]
MRPLVDDDLRLVNAVSLNFLLATGVVGTLVFLYTFLTETGAVSTVFPEGVIELLMLGIPALGLLYAGYWLRSAAFTPVQVWRIGQYALAGALLAVCGATVVTAAVPGWPTRTSSLLFLLASTGTEGALIGVLVRTFAATDLLGEELKRLRAMPDEVDAVLPDETPGGNPDGREGTDAPDGPDGPKAPKAPEEPDGPDGGAGGADGRGTPDGEHASGGVEGTPDGRESGEVDDLLATLSHDLRNPLNVARIRVELAREEGDLDHLDAVVRAHDRMETLIDETLCLARQTGASIDVEPVALRSVAEECWRNVDTGDAALVVETDSTVIADPKRLTRVLENLFRNAVQHGTDGGRPGAGDGDGGDEVDGTDLTVRIGDVSDGFYVADDGRGISPERREKVFQTGYSTREVGTGLGLAIVSR